MLMSRVGVVVIGGGPAGLAAAISASVDGASVLLVERNSRLGGSLNQAIHAGFGELRHGNRLTGPEYAFTDIAALEQTGTFVMLQTSVTKVVRIGSSYQLTLCNRHGIVLVEAKSVILATGCIERSAYHLSIHGSRPAGVFTAGSAQYYLNIMGQLPGRNCIILGSSNIGLVTARRLTLEGARVLGVYEPAQSPVGLLQNVSECLNDFFIPLHCGHTITHILGGSRLKSVIVQRVDKNLNAIKGSENRIQCDSLIIAGRLTPDTELADSLSIPFSEATGGPVCDQNFMTMIEGIFCCGNALYISSMVDYISECGEIAGQSAARYMYGERQLLSISISKDILTITPQCLDLGMLRGDVVFFFRPRETRENVAVKVLVNGQIIHSQEYLTLNPSEVERLAVSFNIAMTPESKVELRIQNTDLRNKSEKPGIKVSHTDASNTEESGAEESGAEESGTEESNTEQSGNISTQPESEIIT